MSESVVVRANDVAVCRACVIECDDIASKHIYAVKTVHLYGELRKWNYCEAHALKLFPELAEVAKPLTKAEIQRKESAERVRKHYNPDRNHIAAVLSLVKAACKRLDRLEIVYTQKKIAAEADISTKKLQWHVAIDDATYEFVSAATKGSRDRQRARNVAAIKARITKACDELDATCDRPMTKSMVLKQAQMTAETFKGACSFDESLADYLYGRIQQSSSRGTDDESVTARVRAAIARLEAKGDRYRTQDVMFEAKIHMRHYPGQFSEARRLAEKAANDSYSKFYIAALDRVLTRGVTPRNLIQCNELIAIEIGIPNTDARRYGLYVEHAKARLQEIEAQRTMVAA